LTFGLFLFACGANMTDKDLGTVTVKIEVVEENDETKRGARHSSRDQAALQTAHDVIVEAGAMCKNALKAVSETDEELRVGNYIVLFDGKDLEGIASPRRNGDGSLGEHFSKAVEVESSYTKSGVLHVDWEHGQDPDDMGLKADDVLGYVDWKTAKRDSTGIYVERVLNRRAKYMEFLEELIKAGLVGNSSEAIPNNVEKKKNGEIVRWPLRRDTLTVQPMEPRMLTQNALAAYKALNLEELITPETDMAGKDDQDETPVTKTIKENDMEKEEFKAMLDTHRAETVAELEPKLTEISTKAIEAYVATLPEVNKGVATIEVVIDEADRPFTSVAEQVKAVRDWKVRQRKDPRLDRVEATMKAMEAKAPQGASEGILSDGGFLLDPTVTAEIIKPMHEEGPFSNDVRKLPVGNNSNSGWINGVDETSRATGSRWGGVQGYRLAEAAEKTASKPSFRRIQWELKKYAVVIIATDELLNDATQFSSICEQASREELAFMLNDDILNGSGLGGPLGVLTSGATVSVTRTDANKILGTDISAMWQRLSTRSKARAKWYTNSETAPQLDALFAVGSTAVLFPYAGFDQARGVRTLYGKPIIETEFNAALGTVGDIVLADMNEYLLWEEAGGVKDSVNMYLYWLTDETAVRFVVRFDGKPSIAAPLTPYKGTLTHSPFVTLSTAS
jgi:HK97 family phage major capsid protein